MLVTIGNLLPITGWDAYRVDAGNVVKYSSKTNGMNWRKVPRNNILIIVLWHEYHLPGLQKKTIVCGDDYYVFSETVVGSTNDFNLIKLLDYATGIWTTDEQFNTLYQQVFQQLEQ